MDVDESNDLANAIGIQIEDDRQLHIGRKSFIGENICKDIPNNLKQFVEKGSMELIVKSDGACGANAAAAHIFKDQNKGPELNMIKNTHIVDQWPFYKDKVSLPYERKVGVGAGAKTVKFKDGEVKIEGLATKTR